MVNSLAFKARDNDECGVIVDHRLFKPWRWREMRRERLELISEELASVSALLELVRHHPDVVCRPAPSNVFEDDGILAAYVAYRRHNDGEEWRCIRCDESAQTAVAVARNKNGAPDRCDTYLIDLCDYCARMAYMIMDTTGIGVEIT